MYLSRLILNPRSQQVRRELSDPYQMHRTIMAAFPENLPAGERVLFRIDGLDGGQSLALLVQSQNPPDWNHLLQPGKHYLLEDDQGDNPAVKSFDPSLKEGQSFRFRLRANPTVKKDRDEKKQGRRVALLREEEQLAWLKRKMQACGADILGARVAHEGKNVAQMHRPGQIHKASLVAVRFDGILQVTEPEKFKDALRLGIGSAKGLGFGLLSLAPV
ncbi:MAG: type I-E CRISPR-associated protein Cas6/Cse3/CasE [Anaerolineales bacterium]